MLRIVSLVALVLLMAGCTPSGSGEGAVTVQKGMPFPSLIMRDLSGGVGNSADLFRGKVVVFNVWATWCPPCRKEMPDLIRLSKMLPSSDFVVMGLSVDEGLKELQQFITDHDVRFPIYWDQGGKGVAADKLQVFKYPETFILNRQGVLIERVIGAYPWASDETVKILRYIAKNGKAP